MRAIVYSSYPDEDPSFRLRMVPVIERLRERGYSVQSHSLFTTKMYRNRNRNAAYRLLVGGLLVCRMVGRAVTVTFQRHVDVVVVHREVFPFFLPIFEKLALRRTRFSILDFDDALYAEPSHGKDWRSWLRKPGRFSEAVRAADVVTASSPVLVKWASAHNTNVRLALTLPPVRPAVRWPDEGVPPTVWIGSDSTLDQLRHRLRAIERATRHFGSTITVMAGDRAVSAHWPPGTVVKRWGSAEEAELLTRPAVGVMPLTSDEWAAGKGAFKALLYMSAGWPVVLSPVGMNEWLVEQSGAGILANSEEDWERSVAELLADSKRCSTLGERGRAWLEQVRGDLSLPEIVERELHDAR